MSGCAFVGRNAFWNVPGSGIVKCFFPLYLHPEHSLESAVVFIESVMSIGCDQVISALKMCLFLLVSRKSMCLCYYSVLLRVCLFSTIFFFFTFNYVRARALGSDYTNLINAKPLPHTHTHTHAHTYYIHTRAHTQNFPPQRC